VVPIGALLLVGTAMSGQDYHTPLLIRPRAQTPFQVKNKAFEAHFEVSDTGGHRVVHGTIHRDSSGRVRTEYIFSTGERTTLISDPVVGEVLALDDVTREASRIRQSNGPIQTGWAFADCIPSFTDEYKIINEVRFRRVCSRMVVIGPMSARRGCLTILWLYLLIHNPREGAV
jgi:hypothetical protein